jgi:outer membrane protein TolC
MGVDLSTMFALDTAPLAAPIDTTSSAALEEEALKQRPEVALARQQQLLAGAAVTAAQAAFLPQLSALGGWELNGGTWHSRSASWVVGAVARINVFRGFADQARLAEAREQVTRRTIEREKAETLARLDVRIAIAQLEAARASELVGRAAVDQARESRRIIRDRYESGLAELALLLRAADAEQQADAQQVTAGVNVLTATATLQRAIGRP